jgi:predicted transcriptional regulator
VTEKYQLTPVEYELMEILWSIKQGTVRDVLAKLPNNRHLAYTSVSTILRILQQKQIVAAEKMGKQHSYRPLITREAFAHHSVNKMVSQVFSGNSVQLVSYLVDKNKLSVEELNAIQRLLDNRKKELGE